MDVHITRIDQTATDELRAAWRVVEESQRADRPYALLEAEDAALASVQQPGSAATTEFWTAVVDDLVVGVAVVGRHLTHDAHLADLEVNVLPEHRRRGIGRALAEGSLDALAATGHTTALCEVYRDPAAVTCPGLEFARALGFETVHQEDHLVLELPAQPPSSPVPEDYELVTWVDRCPDDLLEAYCEMRTRMNADVPLGEVDATPEVRTPERQRESEQRLAVSYTTLTAAVRRRSDGVLGGYTLMFLPHDQTYVWQDDTLVMPEHRGRRLGLTLKRATWEILQRDHPERSLIHTWTDPDNAAMQATNRLFGFRVVERMHEVQRRGPIAAD